MNYTRDAVIVLLLLLVNLAALIVVFSKAPARTPACLISDSESRHRRRRHTTAATRLCAGHGGNISVAVLVVGAERSFTNPAVHESLLEVRGRIIFLLTPSFSNEATFYQSFAFKLIAKFLS